LITPVNFFTFSGTSSGHPSASSYPFTVSGSSGHWSSGTGMPSLSGSGSGQPSGSIPATSGHWSAGSGTPSPSGSRSGQPLGSVPASCGHSSTLSNTPSPSLSGIGHPSGVLAGATGHRSISSVSPSPSLSTGRAGGGGGFLPPIPQVRPNSTSYQSGMSPAVCCGSMLSRRSTRRRSVSLSGILTPAPSVKLLSESSPSFSPSTQKLPPPITTNGVRYSVGACI